MRMHGARAENVDTQIRSTSSWTAISSRFIELCERVSQGA